MLILSLVLFALVLCVLAVAAARGLLRLDDILEVVDPDETPSHSPDSA